MNLLSKIKLVSTNRIVLYMGSRYLTYFVQFLSSLFIAAKLGPYYLGIYGFLLMILNYFLIVNFGIPTSATILIVQNKDNKKKSENYETISMVLIGFLGLIIIIAALYYYYFGIPAFDKYQTGYLLYFVCAIAIISQVNTLLSAIYRVKGRLFEVAFFQSIVPFLILIVLFCAKGKILLSFLIGAYLIGNILSMSLFLYRKMISFKGKPNMIDSKIILNKGFFLFIYNVCFCMIILSTRTIVSIFYTIEQFGYFTFAYTLTNSVILFIDAFTAIIFPKIIDKLNSKNLEEIEATIKSLRSNYISLSHGLMYFVMLFFPLLLMFIPKYSNALVIINMISLTLILYTNSFGYCSLLIAKNKEKIVALISLVVLLFNIALSMFLVRIVQIGYEYVIIGTSFSYFLFSYLCVYFGKKTLRQNASFISVMKDCFPIQQLIPFIIMTVILCFKNNNFILIPFIVFIVLNIKSIYDIFRTFKRILLNPNIIDVK